MNNREPEERLIVERRKREITQITSPRRRRRHGTLRRASVTEQEQLSPAVPPLDLQSIVQEDTSMLVNLLMPKCNKNDSSFKRTELAYQEPPTLESNM